MRFLNHNLLAPNVHKLTLPVCRSQVRIIAWVVCEKNIHGLALGLASAVATSPLRGLVANTLSHSLAQHVNPYLPPV